MFTIQKKQFRKERTLFRTKIIECWDHVDVNGNIYDLTRLPSLVIYSMRDSFDTLSEAQNKIEFFKKGTVYHY